MQFVRLLIVVLIFCSTVKAQEMLIQMKDGSLIKFVIANIDSIYFQNLYQPTDTSIKVTNTQFIGHKGGGATGYLGFYIENTMPSIQYGLKTMNGVEVDIQMSLDGTPWIFHNADIADKSCDTSFHHSITLLHDSVISKIKQCDCCGLTDRLYKLSELIDYWNASPNGFFISLHLKQSGDIPPDTLALIGGEEAYFMKLADNLATVLKTFNHQGQIGLEFEDDAFCTKIKTLVSGIKCFLLAYSDFPSEINEALAGGYFGISHIFSNATATLANVLSAQSKGLQVAMWTPYYIPDLQTALNKHPDYIQTDRMSAIKDLKLVVVKPSAK